MPDAYLAGLDEARFARGWVSALCDGMTLVGISGGGRIDGFAKAGAARDDDPPCTGQLWVLNLHPVAFGSGLASALHTAATEWLVGDGHEAAYLWVARDNPRARRFYECEGWSADGVAQKEPFGEAEVPEVRYVRMLRV